MPLSLDSIHRHRIPAPALIRDLLVQESDKAGNPGRQFTIPSGSRFVAGHPADLTLLLGIYGVDQTVAHFILPDEQIITAFFRITDAIKALPGDLPQFIWDFKTETYVPKTYTATA